MGTTVENSDHSKLVEQLVDELCGTEDLAARAAKRRELAPKSYHELQGLWDSRSNGHEH